MRHKMSDYGTSPVVPWLRLHVSTVGDVILIHDSGISLCHMV